MSDKAKCISCAFLVPDDTKAGRGLCWWVPATERKPLDTLTERKCNGWKLGAMQNLRNRAEFKP